MTDNTQLEDDNLSSGIAPWHFCNLLTIDYNQNGKACCRHVTGGEINEHIQKLWNGGYKLLWPFVRKMPSG